MAEDTALEVVVTYDYGHVNGGAAKVAIAGAVGLKARGHRVIYFAPVGPADPALAAAGVETVVLDQSDLNGGGRISAAARGVWNSAAATALRATLQGVDVARAVVYQHGWAKAMSPACQRVIAKSGLATVYHMHEYFAACPNGAFFDFKAGENCARRPMSAACMLADCDARNYAHKQFRVARHGALSLWGGQEANLSHTIHIGEMQLAAMRPFLPAAGRTTYAPNPIDVEDRGPASQSDDAPFLFVGRFSAEKGAHIAAKAARSAAARIAFVGEGEAEADIRRAAPDAAFFGWLDPAGVGARMREARALVFPSIWRECQPLTVLEALAQGLPAIVSAECAASELVVDGETGVHVPAGDVEAWASAMRRLSDPQEAARMGRNAHFRYWANPHTLDRHLDAVEPALRQALAAKRTAG